jgi:hypothetical protein
MLRYTIATAVFIALVAMPMFATSVSTDEIIETMMEAEGTDTLFLGQVFGPDSSSGLHFTSNVNLSTGAFSYSLVSGQKYLGSAFSLTTTGTFNSALGEFVWTTTTQLGSQHWSGSGSGTWSGDPTFKENYTVTLNGVDYAVTGTIDPGAHTSSGEYTFKAPDGTVFGPYKGTDKKFGFGLWTHVIKVPVTPVTPEGVVIIATVVFRKVVAPAPLMFHLRPFLSRRLLPFWRLGWLGCWA